MTTIREAPFENRVRSLWNSEKAVLNAWLLMGNPYSAELMAAQGFDSVTIDLQHGMIGFETALTMLQAISGQPVMPVVRIPGHDFGLLMKLLDAGAAGIICPLVDSRDECRRFVAACRYAPQGNRSFGPARGLPFGPDYCRRANDHVLTFAMIETREGLGNLDEILSVEGLDAVLIGPNDLSISLGHAPASEPTETKVIEAIDLILARCKAHGVKAGIFCSSGQAARRRIEQGFDFVNPGTDTYLLSTAARAGLGEAQGVATRPGDSFGYTDQ